MANRKNIDFIERAKKLGYSIDPNDIEKIRTSENLSDVLGEEEENIQGIRKPCGAKDNLELDITAVTREENALVVTQYNSIEGIEGIEGIKGIEDALSSIKAYNDAGNREII